MKDRWYGWGVDGYGRQHYICDYCEMYFGVVDINLVEHDCDKSKPKYHNRGVIYFNESLKNDSK